MELDRKPVAARRWYHWHEPGTTKEEKWLIFKLDLNILTYLCLTFFVKYLDQTNVTNAFAAGMKNDLNMKGNELNWMTTWFNIGVILGAPASTLALTRINPRWWLPSCTTIWSLLVLFMYKATHVRTIYILRFFCGMAESGVLPGAWYIIGSWYKKSEIGRRTSLFYFSATGGQMLSGIIQGGIYRSLKGHKGLASWRWLFIIDFVISMPIALMGLCVCPDEPKAKRIWWMSEKERQRCIQRIKEDDRDPGTVSWNLEAVKTVLKSWQLYAFCIAWGTLELTCGVSLQRWMVLWLSSVKVNGHKKYSVPEVNFMPVGIGGAQLVWMLIASWTSDYYRNPSIVIVALGTVQLFCYIVFAVWPNNNDFIMAAFYICSAYGAIGPLIGSWLNSSCGGDRTLRAFTSGLTSSVGFGLGTAAQQTMFPVSQAPKFRPTHGFIFGIVWIVFAAIVWCGIIMPIMERRFPPRPKETQTDLDDEPHPSPLPDQRQDIIASKLS